MGFFPTKRALDLARTHTTKARLTHEQVAEDIISAGVHIQDWQAAQYELSGIDPNDEDGDTLDALSHIDEVADEYYAIGKGWR